jgi:RNA-directed DNA polymerase
MPTSSDGSSNGSSTANGSSSVAPANAAPESPAPTAPPPGLSIDGRALESAADVAQLFDVSPSRLIHGLYRAPDSTRYHHFEIPKSSGGMRLISAPRGLVRELQDKLLPLLQQVYDAHPSAHGFIAARSVVTNAQGHVGRQWVLNVDLSDFFPSINFGRVRGLFMAPPFMMGPKAASIVAQICTHRNGLPQGAPTSPVISNFIAAALDRRLTRLAKANRCRYSRYADDITFSTTQALFPPALAYHERSVQDTSKLHTGEALEQAIMLCGFSVNPAKVRLQGRHRHQGVTGLCVNSAVNVERTRIRKIRAMLHAWQKFGLENAGVEFFEKYARMPDRGPPENPGALFRNAVYGQLAFVKMVRGADDPVFLKLCAKLIDLDPNPSKFVRQMVFGAADYDVFISHASEDKAEIARPIFAACERLGIKAFLDEEHIGWGQSFTKKINTALGAARTVLVVVSSSSVSKEWPLAEINTALAFEVSGQKTVVPVMVGKPDLTHLPLLRGKKWIAWNGDATAIAQQLKKIVKGTMPEREPESQPAAAPKPKAPQFIPRVDGPQVTRTAVPVTLNATATPRRSLLSRIFGK